MKLLQVTAHPDDESLWAGRTLAMLGRLGVELTFMCCSPENEGEHGDPCRSDEFYAACEAFGAEPIMLQGWREPSDLTAQFDRHAIHDWNLILTHSSVGELNIHPDHVQINQSVISYLESKQWTGMLVTYAIGIQGNVSFTSENRSDWHTKRKAMLSHKSQVPFLKSISFADRLTESFQITRLGSSK